VLASSSGVAKELAKARTNQRNGTELFMKTERKRQKEN
jgi:hypothetical protein